MAQCFPHRHLEWVAQLRGIELIHLDDGPGVAVLCVGSGLLMATVDAVHDRGLAVHCALDMGRASTLDMAHLIEWAACVERHCAVLVNTWHSRSWASDLGRALVEEFPATVSGTLPAAIFYRLRGLGEDSLPSMLANHDSLKECMNSLAASRAATAPRGDGFIPPTAQEIPQGSHNV